jgi:2'-5' RNA ligase
VRLFVAIWPPPPVVAAISELEHPDMGTVRWTDPSRWHVTLVFLGNPAPDGPSADATSAGDATTTTTTDVATAGGIAVEEAVVEEAIVRLRRVPVAAHARTVARLGAVTASFGRSVLYVPVLGLDALAGAVRTAHAPGAAGSDGTDPVPFNGHLTLGRARRRRDDVRPLAGVWDGMDGRRARSGGLGFEGRKRPVRDAVHGVRAWGRLSNIEHAFGSTVTDVSEHPDLQGPDRSLSGLCYTPPVGSARSSE